MSYLRPIFIFALSFALYALLAGEGLTRQSIAPHFSHLAEAFLAGRLHLQEPLPSTYDLIRYQGLWYVAQPPLPALLMLPLAVFRFVPDVLFSVGLGALNVALCDVVLSRALPALSPRRRLWLVIFFGFGTAHAYTSALGTVWFLGQIAAVLSAWVFLLGMQLKSPLLAGLGTAGVLLARPAVVLGLGVLYFWEEGKLRDRVLFALPILLAGLFLAGYNQARFASPLDFGYAHLEDAPNIRERRMEHGLFSPVFLPDNLYTATLRPPIFKAGRPEPNPWGMGLLWTSPVLFYAALVQDKKLWVSVALVMLFPLLYHNSGSAQFGYRFVLDALPLLMVLVGQGARRGKEGFLVALCAWSVLIHLWGYAWFYPLIVG